MSNILVIAEKKDVASDISKALFSSASESEYKSKGCFTGTKDGNDWYITNAVGHLLELCDPDYYDPKYKNWLLEDLPIYFADWKLIPDSVEYKQKRLNIIKDLIKTADIVIAAGDPDDEGQFLIDELIDYYKFSGPVKRVFINDSMPANIRKEFAHLKDNADYINLGRAAYARSMADKCFGVNESRLAGLSLNRRGLSVGRVQTPTLGMIIARDELIEGHIKEKYYEMDAFLGVHGFPKDLPFKFKPEKKYLEDNSSKYILDRSILESIGDHIEGKDINFSSYEKDKVTNPPMPFTSTTLISEMNRRYGYNMKQVLDITQNLRTKHAITYNRSKIPYLKEEHFKDAPDLFKTILGGSLVSKYNLDFSRHASCFNDAEVKEHHGIIPQKNDIDPSTLTTQEKNVYLAICDRYAMQFIPPMVQKVSTSTISISQGGYTHALEHAGYKMIDPGYTKYFGREKKEEEEEIKSVFIPAGSYTGHCNSYKIYEKETKPPARYTDGTLASDMASIAKYVNDPTIKEILKKKDEGVKGENGSIGTVATRPIIIETLIERKFIERKGKNIISTQLGRDFYKLLPESISKANTTARWWLIQEAIRDGSEPDVNAVQKAVIEEFMKHKDTAYKGASLTPYTVKDKATGTFDGKEITFNKEWGAHTFTETEIKDLLAGKEISFEAISSKGTKYTAEGKLEKQKYKGKTFYGFKLKEKEIEVKPGYFIGKWKGKNVSIKETFGGHTFSEEEKKKLLAGEEITFTGTSAKGNEFTAKGVLKTKKYKGVSYVGVDVEFI